MNPNRPRRRPAVAALLAAVGLVVSCGDGGTGLDADPSDGAAFVGPDGGFVAIGSRIRVDVPPGALDASVMMTIEPVPTPPDLADEGAIGQAYRIGPTGLVLGAPIRVEIAVPAPVRGEIPVSDLTLRRSTTASGALAPAGVALSDIRTTETGVSGESAVVGTFSAAAPQNRDPSASAGGDRNVVVGDRVDLDGSGSDPDGDPLTFSWSVIGPDGSPVVVEGADEASASFTADRVGEYRASLTVDDGRGGTDSSTAVITARENRNPTADAGGDRTVDLGSTVQLDGSGSADPDGDPLSFSWTVTDPDGAPVAVADADRATASFTVDRLGEYAVTLTVGDGRGATGTTTITVTVVEGNRPPTVDAGSDQTVDVGTEVQLNGFAQDPDGDALTLAWTVVDPDGNPVTVENPNQSIASFVAGRAGTYVATLTADDGRGGVTSSSLRVHAGTAANRPPDADAGPDVEVPLNSPVSLDGSDSDDPDGDELTYAWVQVGGPAVTLDDPTAARPSFTPTVEGDYVFQLTVSDGEFTDVDTVTITAANQSPDATLSGPDLVVTGDEVAVTATVSDPDGDTVAVAWSVTGPGGAVAFEEAADGLSITFTPTGFGDHTVMLQASDGENLVETTRVVDVNLAVAGTYAGTTFVATRADNCQGLVPVDEPTTDDLVVEQPDPSTVILRLSGLTEFIANDPVGTLDGDEFDFAGTITVTDGSTNVDAFGTITGTFTSGPPPGMDLAFDFAAFGCVVEGTITK